MSWQGVLLEPARIMLTQIGQFLSKAIAVFFILVIGWRISKGIKTAVTKILRGIKLDDISANAGIDRFLAKGGISYSLSDLSGVICYWLAILTTFMIALTPFNLVTPHLIDKVISYVPNIIAAVFILVFGMFVAVLLRNVVRTAAANAGLSQINLLSKIVEVAVVVFAVIIALEELGIGVKITEITLAIILGTFGLGLALAFGLGCKDIVGKSIEELIEKLKKK